MQLICIIAALLITADTFIREVKNDTDQDKAVQNIERNFAQLKVGEEIVFDQTNMAYATLMAYPNQLLFTVMDEEGQNLTITFAGKGISQRKPNELVFNSPGLFHGFSEENDVFFIAFAKLVADREPGQLKYERHLPQLIMEGVLKVISWTDINFEFTFEGKLGEENQVNSPDRWLPFSGCIKATSYQQFKD
ncbi:hypothetical protein ACFOUP_12545 [Belliella kenyensis]|uniref:Uncharacterized protein n=1 Tax=Belliella kenyensis TaxID=1472724 RepID=A0ABV8EPE8_9BACT|nr:hypothetical protein [Belliella kenyensis]MCH7400802.1 hypothetical protein [Belliella kenyensis]MDN3601910.1 hypothetical protein [Belliella kenyensis]